MKTCIAFVAQGRSENAWRPCRRKAGPHSVFCHAHESVLAGAMLGAFVYGAAGVRELSPESDLKHMPVRSERPS